MFNIIELNTKYIYTLKKIGSKGRDILLCVNKLYPLKNEILSHIFNKANKKNKILTILKDTILSHL